MSVCSILNFSTENKYICYRCVRDNHYCSSDTNTIKSCEKGQGIPEWIYLGRIKVK